MSVNGITRSVIVALAVGSLAACNKGGDSADGSKANTAGSSAGGPDGVANIPAAGPAMSDANIFYILDAVNMGDSAKGALASTKGTSADVREFAKIMVRDHHSMRQQVQDLSKRLAIQPAPAAGDSFPAKLNGALSRLTSAAKGRDFDKAYMDHEVAAQREMLTLAVSAMSMTRNSEIKNLIQNAAPVIQAHLDKAAAIQKNLQK